MLERLATCISAQSFLMLIVFHSIACDCQFPNMSLTNGRFVFESPDDANETIAKEMYVLGFECHMDYQRIGPKYIQCKEGQWSDEVPECTEMHCLQPPFVGNSHYELHSQVNGFPVIGSFVTYSCNVGFALNDRNASTLHCVLDPGADNASWEGEKPFCREASCPDPGVSKHGSRKGHCCFFGDILHYSCEEDYELVGNSEITCLGDTWSAERPLCRPLGDHCEVPPSIPHGVVLGYKDGDYFRPYDEAEIHCEAGYKYKGPTEFPFPYIMCEEENQWENEFGECIDVFCDVPQPLANGTIPELLATNQTSFPYNFELTYICEEGFRLIGGDSWRTCDKRGWSGKTPRCEATFCPDPGVPENGHRTGSNFAVGAKVRFKCFTGYHLIGPFERYCKPNGQWTGELSRCDTPSNHCPDPGIPIKGYKNSSSYDMGDKVGFHCEPGHIQIGSEVRECLPNRTWSGTETTCLGLNDFDNSAQVRDILKAKLAEKAEEQMKEINKFLESFDYRYRSTEISKMLDFDFPVRLILYFAFDVSGSVGKRNFDISIEFAKAIVKRVGISEYGARAGALTFPSPAETRFLPLSYTTTEQVVEALDKIEYTGGGTTYSVLRLIREDNIPLVDEEFGRRNTKSVIFIITDGKANMGGSPEKEAEELKMAGVEIYCIGITGSVERESLYRIASKTTDASGEHFNVYILQNYVTLSWLAQEITNQTMDYSQCGLGNANVGIEGNKGRIIDGKLNTEPWPWMAALYTRVAKSKSTDVELQCGGSIINDNFLLTAAHCLYTRNFEKKQAKDIIVKLGLTDIQNEEFLQESEVAAVYIHPKYSPGPLFDYDIALLQLNRSIEFNPFVRPICLPPMELPADSPLYSSEEFGWTIGWGHQAVKISIGNRRMTMALKEYLLPIQSPEWCNQNLVENKFLPSLFTDQMFCAGDRERGNDTCFGDSGSPLIQSQMNSEGYLYWTQVGILSWSTGCGQRNTFGYYSHVQRLKPWIDSTIREALSKPDQNDTVISIA